MSRDMRDSRSHVETSGSRLKVVSKQLSVTAAAASYGISRQQLTHLVRRYRDGGLEAVGPRSRRPLSNPGHTPDATRRTASRATGCRSRGRS